MSRQHHVLAAALLTSLTDPRDVINALSAGADNFLRKQILDLLVSTFEDLVAANGELRAKEADLAQAHERAVEQLAQTQLERDRLHAVLAALPEGFVVVDLDARVVEANENLGRLLGLPTAPLRGVPVGDILQFVDQRGHGPHADERAIIRSLRDGERVVLGTSFDLYATRRDGTRFPAIARTAPIRNASGAVIGAVGVLEDIASLVAHNPATGLPGHGILVERLRAAMEDVYADERVAVIAVALDGYGRLRARLSRSDLNGLLGDIAARLRTSVESDRVKTRSNSASAAYLGSGEFAIVLPELAGQEDAIVIGELIAAELRRPVRVDGVDMPVTATVAVGLVEDGIDPSRLVAALTGAARDAGTGHGAVVTPDPALHAAVVESLRHENELRQAIAANQLRVHYQPQVQLHGGGAVAVEALVRWPHPERGLLGADEVVAVATEAGLICDLGWWVLDHACRQVAEWQRVLPHGERLVLSVNLAAEQLADVGVVDRIRSTVAASGLDPTSLVVEITEGSVLNAAPLAGARLAAIKALGAHVAIDDFGVGYSSLSQLRQLPVDILKIDRSFVAGMLKQPADAAIVAGTARLARSLGLETVAEGVETLEQLVQLRVLGCDKAQGYYWSRPLPAEAFHEWWSANAEPAPATPAPVPRVDQGDDELAADDTIAYLVHELRSPLAAISGFAELLAESGAASDAAEFVEAILRNARQLEIRLAQVAKARSVLENGLALEMEELNMTELVETLVHDLQAQLAPHPVTFTTTGETDASVDPAALSQAVTNLLTNAAKFSRDADPIDVAVSADASQVTITVRDYGPGIPEYRRQELFRKFSRLGSRVKGMGIGLYLSRLIADAHGGSIGYEPAPDGGSAFSIRLPASGKRTRHR